MKKIQTVLSILWILALLAFALPSSPVKAASAIYYVKANATGSNNGTSWANAYTSLQSAIAKSVSGDEIWVAAGTYKPTTSIYRSVSFKPKAGTSLYGGFAGTETLRSQRNWTNNVTILSGDIGIAGAAADNSFHVVVIEDQLTDFNTNTLDGFTITGGNANSGVFGNSTGGGIFFYWNFSINLANLIITNNNAKSGGGMNSPHNLALQNILFSNNSADDGGGIYNQSNSLILTNVIFNHNTAEKSGGGIYNVNSSPVLTNVTFSHNTAKEAGGGMLNFAYSSESKPTLTNVIFSNNAASEGGGMGNLGYSDFDDTPGYAMPQLTNVTFIGNTASNTGGGMQNYSYPGNFDYVGGFISPVLNNVAFINNSAVNAGGGMENHFHTGPRLTNVTFSGNSAATGGAIANNNFSDTSLTNVTFNGNSASVTGGWASNDTNSSLTLVNVTIKNNQAAADRCGLKNTNTATAIITSSILWGNGTEFCGGEQMRIQSSIIAGGCPAGATCTQVIDQDPLLLPIQNNGGFTKTMALQPNSPALDITGNPGNCAATDQRGTARPQGTGCDAGAYEKAQVAVTLRSEAVNDGWILEGNKNSGLGGTINNTDASFYAGDDVGDRQYRSILSFNTATLALPTGAVISGARLKLKAQSALNQNLAVYNALGSLLIDVRKGAFSANTALQPTDFNGAASKDNVGSIGEPTDVLYFKTWPKSIAPFINTGGITQFRLRLTSATDNDLTADRITFYSGDAAAAGDRPQLIVYYYLP